MGLLSAWNNFKSSYNQARQDTAARIAANKSGSNKSASGTSSSGSANTTSAKNSALAKAVVDTHSNSKNTGTYTYGGTTYNTDPTTGKTTVAQTSTNTVNKGYVPNVSSSANNSSAGNFKSLENTGNALPSSVTQTKYTAPTQYNTITELVKGSIATDPQGAIKNINKALGYNDEDSYAWMGDPDAYNEYKKLITDRYGADVWNAYSNAGAQSYLDTYGEGPGATRRTVYTGGTNQTLLQDALDELTNATNNYVDQTKANQTKDIGQALSDAQRLFPSLMRLAKNDAVNSTSSDLNWGARMNSVNQANAKAMTDTMDENVTNVRNDYRTLLANALKSQVDAKDKNVDAITTYINSLMNKDAYTDYGATAAGITGDAQVQAAKLNYDAAIATSSNANATANQKEGYAQYTKLMNGDTQPDQYALMGALTLMGMDPSEALSQASTLIVQWNKDHPNKIVQPTTQGSNIPNVPSIPEQYK